MNLKLRCLNRIWISAGYESLRCIAGSQARSILQAPQSILIALTDRHSQADGNTGRNSRVGVSTYQHPLSLGSRSIMPPSGRCADVLAISICIVPSGFTNSWTSLVGVCSYCIVDRLSELFVGKHLIRIMFLLTHGEQSLVLTFSWLSPEPPPSQSRIDRQVPCLPCSHFPLNHPLWPCSRLWILQSSYGSSQTYGVDSRGKAVVRES